MFCSDGSTYGVACGQIGATSPCRHRLGAVWARFCARRLQVLDTAGNPDTKQKTAAEMYADILAMRESADAAFQSADHLPRVVVLGDQSSGKTSVLEMVAQARLFPRGDGEMMTRTPIQVTMSPDSEHTAKLRDSSRVYRLDDRNDLADLREEIAALMTASVPKGSSVSSTTIALDVRGPGLRYETL